MCSDSHSNWVSECELWEEGVDIWLDFYEWTTGKLVTVELFKSIDGVDFTGK